MPPPGRLPFTTELPAALDGADAVFSPSAPRGAATASRPASLSAAREIASTMTRPAVWSQVDVRWARRLDRRHLLRAGPEGPLVASTPSSAQGAASATAVRTDRSRRGGGTGARGAREVYRPCPQQAPILHRPAHRQLIQYAASLPGDKDHFITRSRPVRGGGGRSRGAARDRLTTASAPSFSMPARLWRTVSKDTWRASRPTRGPESSSASCRRGSGQRRAQAGHGERVRRALGGSVAGKRIGRARADFKPNTDDMRTRRRGVVPVAQGGAAPSGAFDR